MKNKRSEKNDVDYFKNLKLVLKFGGISLTPNNSLLYNFYTFFVLSFSLTNLGIIINEILQQDFETVMDKLVYQFGSFVGVIKALAMFRNRIEIGRIMERLEKKPFLPNPERGIDEEKLIKECTRITNIQEKSYWITASVCIAFDVGFVIIKRIATQGYPDFPFGTITIVNVTRSPNYEIVLACQSISMFYTVAHFTAADLTAAAFAAHISTQFRMLQKNLENMIKLCYDDMLKDQHTLNVKNVPDDDIDALSIPWKYLKKRLTDAVEYHLKIIEVAEEFEDAFSGLLLAMFLNNLGIYSSTIYRLSAISFNDKLIYVKAGELLSAIMQALIVCYWGEQLVHESQLVGNSVFGMKFAGTDLRFQKGLILIIRRSQNPVSITAAKFTAIGLSTFSWILQKSYAAYAVLQHSKAQSD